MAVVFIAMIASTSQCHGIDYRNFTENSKARFGVESNFSDDQTFTSFLEIHNTSSENLPAGSTDWSLYFHFVRKIKHIKHEGVILDHIQGDLYRITPTDRFPGLKTRQRLRLSIVADSFISSSSYFMPNVFLVDSKGKQFVFKNTATELFSDYVSPFTTQEQYLRTKQPRDGYSLVTPELRYSQRYDTNIDEDIISIIPTPKQLHISKGKASLNSRWRIFQTGGLRFEVDYLQNNLKEYGLELASSDTSTGENIILLRVAEIPHNTQDKTISEVDTEAYELDITSNKITITASSKAGIFYGIQSLLSLLPAANNQNSGAQASLEVPAIRAFDKPRYPWRGMHYDIARNFHGKRAIFSLIEQMGRYKLNKLHLHLTDDEGWRIEIPGLEELTRVGATRCFDLEEKQCLLTQLGSGPQRDNPGTGYLSRQDYLDIVQFAHNRNITVIPEIDMPGHARAAIVAMKARYHSFMEQGDKAKALEYLLSDPHDRSEYRTVQNYNDNAINVCQESTYRFFGKVIYELQKMHRDAGVNLELLHVGGDEVGRGAWTNSPACKALFQKHNSQVVGVDDLKAHFVRKVVDIAKRRGISVMGWEDGLMYDKNTPFPLEGLGTEHIVANAWDNIWENGVADRAYILANAGYKVVLSSATHLYFDHPYETHPDDRGYHWATRFIDLQKVFGYMPDTLYLNAKKTFLGNTIQNLDNLVNKVHTQLDRPKNILGMQGQLWSETVRNQNQMEKMVFPRLIAMAERAWHKADWEGNSGQQNYQKDWSSFLSSLVTKDLPKLDQQGVAFYLPPPGAKIENNTLHIKSVIPGVLIECRLDNESTWRECDNESVGVSQSDTLGNKVIYLRSRIGSQTSREVRVKI